MPPVSMRLLSNSGAEPEAGRGDGVVSRVFVVASVVVVVVVVVVDLCTEARVAGVVTGSCIRGEVRGELICRP